MYCVLCQRRYEPTIDLIKIVSFSPVFKEIICPECRGKFEKISHSREKKCERCLKKMPNSNSLICEECLYWMNKYPNISYQHHALFFYNDIAKEWLHQYKFLRDYRLRTSFASEIYEFYLKHAAYLFIPIPISEKRMIERGFNQVEAFLKSALVKYDSYLSKENTDLRQSHRKRLERLKMVQPFKLREKTSFKVDKIIIVDDIYTTGRTIYHALDVFSQVGITKLEGFTLFR